MPPIIVATGIAIINDLPIDLFASLSSIELINSRAIDIIIAQVGIFEMKNDVTAVVIIIARRTVSILPPAFLSKANNIRLVIGVFMIAPAIPKEAIIKNMTGCAKPKTAPSNRSDTLNIGINPIVSSELTAKGIASVTNKTRKNKVMPIVFLPSKVKPYGTGISAVIINIINAEQMPIFFRIFINNLSSL